MTTADTSEVVCATAHEASNTNTSLATALIRIKTMYGWSNTVRALIDQGSMTSFINERTVKLLKLKKTTTKIKICGIAGSVEPAKGTVKIEIRARYPTSFNVGITAIILKKLTTLLPNNTFEKSLINDKQIEELVMAHPDFNKCGGIDMILGADVYASIILSGMIKPVDNSYVLQETELGWIISGPVNKNRQQLNEAVCMMSRIDDMDEKLQRFWETEEMLEDRILTPDEQRCVEYFNNTIRRDKDGVYVASLPFRSNPTAVLGDSRRMAMAQLFQMERKFEKKSTA